ncbi:hypothetical protein LRS74_22065 [Streptomyces sp. LX-29]|uniref:hypothetical protein n=1 Tax=Streptomyces sp. LX-29 TaxID=2900152 RepID=UPI00240E1BDC|nr:hypothetical protein [Streptomyces sp. LX-29]WFB09428.1 hypothetical protein LRS74_22065 [Streptomyces sp. LX-29]
MSLPSSRWRIGPAPERRPSRTEEGDVTMSFPISRAGKPVAIAPLTLTPAEAEQLHAALCYVLAGQRPPDGGDVPECRSAYPRNGPVVRWP